MSTTASTPIRSLGLLALVLVLLFSVRLVGGLIPWQPLDPAWQWRLMTILVNTAPLPLLALALLQIAVVFDPTDSRLRQRQQLFSQWAVAAVLGYLLLLPLQLSAGLHQQNTYSNAQVTRIASAERRLASPRKVVATAGSTADFNQSLKAAQGPVLGPADLANPLPLVKAQVLAVLDQAHAQVARDRAALPTAALRNTVLPDFFRNTVTCLLLAGGFAAFARPAGSNNTLFETLRARLRRTRIVQLTQARRLSEREYLRHLHGEEEP